MCGIAGWFGRSPDKELAESFVSKLSLRGPDGSGIWQNYAATLVHTRLAVIDLTDAGSQPMVQSADGDVSSVCSSALVFNGEIYNHKSLRDGLKSKGVSFSGGADSEVLHRLLQDEGVAVTPKLKGMFAFAYWDEEKQEGLLVRDELGIKPLYYTQLEDGALMFSSEMRSLHGMTPNEDLDPEALRDYFMWGSMADDSTYSANVKQLPAGCMLKYHDGEFEVQEWVKDDSYSVVIGAESSTVSDPMTYEDAVCQTRAALDESISRHLVADVPIGIFLSGGIDSTAVLALARHKLGPSADIRTFSIAFEDPEFDESVVARKTAEHFGAKHTEWKITEAEGIAELKPFLESMDQPSVDGFNVWCVSKLAKKEGMKVVLSGLGGDEFFAGYSSFDRIPKFLKLRSAMGPLRHVLALLLRACKSGSRWRRLEHFLRGSGSYLSAYHAQKGIFTEPEARALTERFTGKLPESVDWSDSTLGVDNPREGVSWMEVTRYMRNQLLRDSDVYSMAHSLELRVPLVDSELAKSISVIPASYRLQQGKKLLIDAVPEIPDWVKNQTKRGFRFPFQQWMESEFRPMLDKAKKLSPIKLNMWYRTWAVSVVSYLCESSDKK